MSEESYSDIHAQNISRGQLIEEQERKIEALEIQLKSAREQYEYQLKSSLDGKKENERISVGPVLFNLLTIETARREQGASHRNRVGIEDYQAASCWTNYTAESTSRDGAEIELCLQRTQSHPGINNVRSSRISGETRYTHLPIV